MLLNKNIENISKITENEKSVEVENSEEALDRDRLLKARIMYILKEYPCGLKQKDFLKNYKKFYGEEMSPEKFGLTNMRQVFMQFPEMIHIKMTNSLEITNTYKSSSDYLMFAPIKDITTYLNYLPSDMQVNKSMRVIVEGVYDPSKLWIVPKFKELKQFMDYLRFFYKNKSHMFNIPSNMISMNLLCILYKNNWFFRVLIINVFNNAEVLVFSVDYGKFVKCSIKDLYYMHKKFADIPRFCFRARLANICPISKFQAPILSQNVTEFLLLRCKRVLEHAVSGGVRQDAVQADNVRKSTVYRGETESSARCVKRVLRPLLSIFKRFTGGEGTRPVLVHTKK